MDYLSRLEKNDVFRNAVERLRREYGMRQVLGGIVPGAAPLLVAGLKRALGGPCVTIVKTREAAESFAADAAVYAGADVMVLEPFGVMPLKPVSPPLETCAARVNVLNRMADGDAWCVAAREAAIRRLPPPEVLRRAVIRVGKGDTLDATSFSRDLTWLGYSRVGMVEGPGQYAVRGALVDIFPPGAAEAYRLELLGDAVESVRFFDVWSQRRSGATARVEIPPVREVILSSALVARAVDGIRRRHGAEAAEDAYESLDLYRYFDGVENLLPFLYDELALLPAYCGRVPLLAIIDAQDEPLPPPGPPPFPYPHELFATLDDIIKAHCENGGNVVDVVPAPSEGALNFSTRGVDHVAGHADVFAREARELAATGDVVVSVERPEQVDRLLAAWEGTADLPVRFDVRAAGGGFIWGDLGLGVFPSWRLLDRKPPTRKRRRPPRFIPGDDAVSVASIFDLSPGDLVVHADHGVGRFDGLVSIAVGGAGEELLALTFAGNDRLYVPVDNLGVVYKYVGGDPHDKPLDRIGGVEWKRAKKRARKSAEKLAKQLIEIYAARALREGQVFAGDAAWEEELADTFPFVETPDQLRAVADVLGDMADAKPMDRLICGDVGFGKTEVAVRAALRACADGKQVAVLVPTTILADQHYVTFKERLGSFPLRVEVLSRFRTAKEQKAVAAEIRAGKVDVVVGTHRLLSQDVAFSDLGLLIVDEEQRFGVGHKEKIKEMRKTVDVLTLTATPIPRTLHMSLSGLRDMSLIGTAPMERLPIQTLVAPFDEDLIADAIKRELGRGGQVFFVHNRVRTIDALAAYLGRLVPEASFGVAHGQLHERELERIMHEFAQRRFDVLVSSAIIEAGLDFPNCNTIIINRADTFGLSQLHQLRGRVGRSHVRAYACFLTPPSHSLTDQARERLQALKENTELGAGFRIAMRDLEIRGAGNLLGPEQSGAVAAVGLDLYTQILSNAVAQLKGEAGTYDAGEDEVAVRFEQPARFPADYVDDERQRLKLYRRLADARTEAAVEALEEEVEDRFGPLPVEASRLFGARKIRFYAGRAGVKTVRVRPAELALEFSDDRFKKASSVAMPPEVVSVNVHRKGKRYLVYMALAEGATAAAVAVAVARRIGDTV